LKFFEINAVIVYWFDKLKNKYGEEALKEELK